MIHLKVVTYIQVLEIWVHILNKLKIVFHIILKFIVIFIYILNCTYGY